MCQAMKNKAFLGAIGLGWNETLQEHWFVHLGTIAVCHSAQFSS
jgi:hypothetical protein